MWTAFKLSESLHQRPSDLYCVGHSDQDPVRFWFDHAVVSFGRMVETDLENAAKGAKTEKAAEASVNSRLMKWLDHDGALTNQRFRTPSVTKTRE